MTFNSLTFAVFFAVVYVVYRVLSHRGQNIFLLVASYVFYGWWDWRFLGLIFLSTVVDYTTGIAIHFAGSNWRRKSLLAVSVLTNLGILGLFKYSGFFLSGLISTFDSVGIELDARVTGMILPVGISFYTFQTMSYTIDIYRRELEPTRQFLDFALFVSFFPQLVAGPIVRAGSLLPQLTAPRRIRRDEIEDAFWLILSGYYLKCVLADNLAPFAEEVFQRPGSVNGFEIVVGVWAAAFQIYGDFAGYSRIAIGISRLMGINLGRNFNRPYLASNPREFWQRWHISLSTWLRDYLFIPIGGSRGSRICTYRNLLLTMLLGGLWHGAAWNFVAWGLFHGVLLCVWRAITNNTRLERKSGSGLSCFKALRMLFFFQVTCLGWILFFTPDLNGIGTLLINITSKWEWNGLAGLVTLSAFAVPVMLWELLAERRSSINFCSTLRPRQRLLIYSAVWMAILICGAVDRRQFLYFQF